MLCNWCEYKSICPEWNFQLDEKISEKILSKRVNPFPEFKENENKGNLDIWDDKPL